MHDRPGVVETAPALLRLAHQLTGDPDAAVDVTVEALARAPRRAGHEPTDVRTVAAVVRAAVARRPAPAGPDSLPAADRAVGVLALGHGWVVDDVAEAVRRTPRSVRATAAALSAGDGARRWQALAADPSWALPLPSDLTHRVLAARRRRRAARRPVLLCVLVVATLCSGIGAVAQRRAAAPPPLPATAHEPGLLAWPARGDLVRDRALIATARRLWRQDRSRAPRGSTYVLFAGRVGVGRLVVLQGHRGDGRGVMAVVADHDVTFRHTATRLDVVTLLPDPTVPVLAVPYDGNLNIPGLQTGPGSRVVQLLVQPGVDRVAERSVPDDGSPSARRPPFLDRRLTDGLSEPWLDVVVGQPASAVRAWSQGRAVFAGVLTPDLQAVAAPAAADAPPDDWAGLPADVDAATAADDLLWFAQLCHGDVAEFSLVWSTADPRLPAPARLAVGTCTEGFPRIALALTGSPLRTDAPVTARLVSLRPHGLMFTLPARGGGTLLVVLGDRSVVAVDIGTQRITGRVAVVPQPAGPTAVTLRTADGREWPA